MSGMATPSTRRRLPIQMNVLRAAMLRAPLLLVVLLLATVWRTEAQGSATPSTPSDDFQGANYNVKISPALAALLIAFICGFFFLGFFSVYLRRCAGDSGAIAGRGLPGFDGEGFTVGRRRRGLDRAVLETLPTMAYAKAKELRPEKEAMECAVCLSEFSDEDILRLLPGCCHVFHVDCVDVWLESHVTCPVCRANLSDPSTVTAADSRGQEVTSGDADTREEEEDLEAGLGAPVVPAVRRWHSTGHEAAPGAPEDRYTLRLPEHVRREIMEAGRLRRAASLTVPSGGEASGRRGYREGAGAGRSGRWGFLRTFSVRRMLEAAPAPVRSASSKRIFPSGESPSDIAVAGDRMEGKSESDKNEGKPTTSSTSSKPAEDRV